MASGSSGRARPRVKTWTRALVVQVAIVMALPVVLGAVLGFWEVNPVEGELLSSVGSEAHLFLDSFPDASLVVEIAYQDSAGPPPGTSVATLFDRINETCQKSQVTLDEHAFTSSSSSFSESDLLSLETSERQHWPVPGTMSLFYLYLGGSFGPSSDTLGLAYRGSSIAIFAATIASSAGGQADEVTTTVLVHEFGHELGLVGIVGNAPNEDPAHPDHSNDPSDVMYWAVDTTAITLLLNPPGTQFDSADLADLSTVRTTPILYELLPWVILAAAFLGSACLVVVDLRRRRRASGP